MKNISSYGLFSAFNYLFYLFYPMLIYDLIDLLLLHLAIRITFIYSAAMPMAALRIRTAHTATMCHEITYRKSTQPRNYYKNN